MYGFLTSYLITSLLTPLKFVIVIFTTSFSTNSFRDDCVKDHTWQKKNNCGYQRFKNNYELFTRYSQLMDKLPELIEKGLSAAVYTQTTDVEIETNGLMTYDRKEIKMPVDKLKMVHLKLYTNKLQKKGLNN